MRRLGYLGTTALCMTAVLPGCMGGAVETRGYALYPVENDRPSQNEVAKLSATLPGGSTPGTGSVGFIKAVDGRDVSTLDTAFELLPGCHVVRTESRLLVSNLMMTWSGELGYRVFVFDMKPGHSYTVVVELAERMANTARVLLYATEQDASGAQLKTVQPTTNLAQIAACLRDEP